MIKSEFGTDARGDLTFSENIFRTPLSVVPFLPFLYLVSKLTTGIVRMSFRCSLLFVPLPVDRGGHANGNSTTDGNGGNGGNGKIV